MRSVIKCEPENLAIGVFIQRGLVGNGYRSDSMKPREQYAISLSDSSRTSKRDSLQHMSHLLRR